MSKLPKPMMLVVLLSLLGACNDSGYGAGLGGGDGSGSYYSGGPSGAADATFSLSVVNDDAVDYALWIEWQDTYGNVNQNFMALLPAAPPGSFSQAVQDVPVVSGVPYALDLLDPSGNLWATMPLGTLNPGDVVPVNLTVVNSAFLAS